MGNTTEATTNDRCQYPELPHSRTRDWGTTVPGMPYFTMHEFWLEQREGGRRGDWVGVERLRTHLLPLAQGHVPEEPVASQDPPRLMGIGKGRESHSSILHKCPHTIFFFERGRCC
jgi:hypothetical protein